MIDARTTELDDSVSISGPGGSCRIALVGAEPQEFVGADGFQYLWTAGEAWGRHAPIMFPIVGRVPDDSITVDGTPYPLTQHGFARDLLWELVDSGSDTVGSAVTLRLTESDETLARYPFRFVLEATYRITAHALETTYVVTNPGERPLPYALGSHPGFLWPLEAGGDQSDHKLIFDQPEPSPIRRLDHTLVKPDPVATPMEGDTLPLDPALFLEDAIVLDHPASRSVRYEAASGRGLTLTMEGFDVFVIWSPPAGADFICIEPCQSTSSDIGFVGEFADRPQSAVLAPGESHTYRYELRPNSLE